MYVSEEVEPGTGVGIWSLLSVKVIYQQAEAMTAHCTPLWKLFKLLSGLFPYSQKK